MLQVNPWNLPAAPRRVATLVERNRSKHTTHCEISISNRFARRRSRAWTRPTKPCSRYSTYLGRCLRDTARFFFKLYLYFSERCTCLLVFRLMLPFVPCETVTVMANLSEMIVLSRIVRIASRMRRASEYHVNPAVPIISSMSCLRQRRTWRPWKGRVKKRRRRRAARTAIPVGIWSARFACSLAGRRRHPSG